MNKVQILFTLLAGIGIVLVGVTWWILSPIENRDVPVLLTVPKDDGKYDLMSALTQEKLIRNSTVFSIVKNLVLKDKNIPSGGYKLNKNMNTFQILGKIISGPDYLWVTIPEGMRREQIGEILAKTLLWNANTQKDFINAYKLTKPEYTEGVFFPDTYLLPKDESGELIAKRLVDRFNDKMGNLFVEFAQKNIRWTTGIKIASLIQREAAGPEDMPLISGIIWNRLNEGVKLDIDATLQYMQGKVGDKWWAPVNLQTKTIDSPYNTYIYKGLPPTPISNPGLDAIKAVLNPEETDCIFYLHANMQIHCARTYKEHLENIQKYL
jgi:UPF0755 protein